MADWSEDNFTWLAPVGPSFKWNRAEYMRIWAQLRRFGLTDDDRAELIAEHDGNCPVCGHPLAELDAKDQPQRQVIDHDNMSGVVRGILHDSCNKFMGLAQHDPERLRRAADFIERYQNEENWRGPHRKIPKA